MGLISAPSDELPETGELVPVEAIDRTGLMITSDGAFVRVLKVTPSNPLILSTDDARAVACGFAAALEKLRAGQSIQFYVAARPVRLQEILAELRAEVELVAGAPPSETAPGTPASLARWRLYASIEQSLKLHGEAV